MREILTIIAAVLVAALTAALVAPPFIDWNARRAEIAAEMGERIGGHVAIEGPVSLRLLPAPRLSVGTLAADRPGLDLQAKAATFELSPTALMRGRFEFTQVSLDRPTIAIDPARLGFSEAERARVGVERLRIVDGSLRIAGATPVTFDHVDLTGAADSLAGPYRGAGVWRGSRALDFQFSTAPIEDGKLRGKIAFDDSAKAAHIEIDGDLAFEKGAPTFSGQAVATGANVKGGRPPWRAAFALKATPKSAEASDIDARLGDEDHALTASGSARWTPGAPFDVKLSARNLDLDRFRAAYGGFAFSDADLPASLALALTAESATLGGDTLTQPEASLRLAPGAAPAVKIDTGAPGRSELAYDGVLDPAHWRRLDGRALVSTREPDKLAAWIAPASPEAARWLKAAPFSRVRVAGRIQTGGDGLEAAIAEADLDRSRLAGVVDWRPARPGSPPKLTARLTSPALDIDGLPDLGAFRALDSGDDLSLSLDAQAIKIARFGQSSAKAGRIAVALARTAGVTTLDKLSIADLGGADLTGTGRFGPRGGGIDLRLDAERLTDLAALAQRVAPSAAADAFAARAAALSPARLTFGLATKAGGEIAQVNLSGEAGGSHVSGQLHPAGDGARVEARFRAEAADASTLLRQAGFAVLPLKGLGGARIEAMGEGAPGAPMRAKAHADIAGVKIDFDGEAVLALDHASLRGKTTMTSADLAPLVQLLAFGAPDLTRSWPLQAAADISIGGGTVSADALTAEVAGVRAQGHIARGVDRRVTGTLALDRLSAGALAALALGPPQPAPKGALWPKLKFAAPRFDLPSASVDLSVGRLDLGGPTGQDARMRVTLSPGVVRVSDLRMKLAGGAVSGEAGLRREGEAAIAKARLSAENVAFSDGPFSARASARIDASGAGASMAELVGSLAGDGRVRLADLKIAAAAPDALGRTIEAVEKEDAPVEQRKLIARLAGALDAGPQTIAAIESDVSLAAGRATLSPVAAQAGDAPVRLGASLDLRAGALEARETLFAKPPWDWEGAPPHIDIVWAGRWDAPARKLSAETLVGALAERAVAREAARNAALEADIHERAFFNRRLKFDRKLEADRLAAEEARRKAEEAARAEQERLEKEKAAREAEEKAHQAKDRKALKQLLDRQPPAQKPMTAAEGKPGASKAQAGKPLQLAPPTAAPSRPKVFAPVRSGAAPDPSTAGRY